MVGLGYCVVYLLVLGRPSNLDNRRARVGRACSRCGMGLYFIPDRSNAELLFVAPAFAMCDIGARFSVSLFVRLSAHKLRRPKRLSPLNDLFSKTTASMVLKFHMQHDQTGRLQNGKIQPDRESKMAADTKNRTNNKINFFSRMAKYICKFCMEHKWGIDI